MDAFFVSVELLRRPELRGQPVIVATGTDAAARGVVMAASYEARRFGVHSALPLAIAHRRCPQAVLLPRNLERYRHASSKVMGVLGRFSDRIEVAGLDEAYLDLSGSPAPKTRARQLKREVGASTGLVCSVGLAPNKLLAKIASDLEKPDGLCVLEPDRMLEAVGDRPATLIPGVGERTAERLAGLGIRTVADLAGAPDRTLEQAFGPRLGHQLGKRARGRDDRPLVTDRERKSESRETTFPADVTDTEERLVERALERPGVGPQPVRDCASKRRIELGSRLSNPRPDMSVVDVVLGRVHVDAADHIGLAVEHRVREARALVEVAGMALEVRAVLVEAHLVRPPALGSIAGRATDVLDARTPGQVVALVVLRPKWLQRELVRPQPTRRLEAGWDEHREGATTSPGREAEAAWPRRGEAAAAA